MSTRIKIGQKYYQWTIHQFHWIKAVELMVVNSIDSSEVLFVAYQGKQDYFTIRVIQKCIELAISKGWYSQKYSLFLHENKKGLMVNPTSISLKEGEDLCNQLCALFGVESDAIDQSNEVDLLIQFEDSTNRKLPVLFKQLYIQKSGHKLGPDYGFLSFDHHSQRMSVVDAQLEIRQFVEQHHLPFDQDDYVPFLYWGTGIFSLIRLDNGAIYVFDPNLYDGQQIDSCLWYHLSDFGKWLSALKLDRSGRSIWMQMYQIRGVV